MTIRRGRLAASLIATAGLGYVGLRWYYGREREMLQRPLASLLTSEERRAVLDWRPPSRITLINDLKASGTKDNEYDLVIIGGGATGTGCALDGASRGLKVALLERDDFSSGTSSKSTKLVHGGVRYLEKAFLRLDYEQFLMVKEALAERSTFLRIAPHLTETLPIMLPIYRWWQIPYYWAGSKAYDLVAGQRGLQGSYFLSKSRALQVFPMLRKDSLVGAMVYYDGAQNDARTNVALALTAIQQGGTVTNYTEVVDLIKEPVKGEREGLPQIRGVIVKDRQSGETFKVYCKGVISATGPFCDLIRKMDDPTCDNLVQPSVGTHIVFPSYYSPRQMGLVDPASSDGRVIFFLPWEDSPSQLTFEPKASKKEIDFIVEEVQRYLDPVVQVRKSDVLAAWSGLRPLVRDPRATSTQEMVRNHIVMVSPSGLMTIAGGKWTTYRRMAEETINTAIEEFRLKPKHLQCRTEFIPLIGAHGYQDNMYVRLVQQFGLETDVAQHLAKSYGDRAPLVAALCESCGRRWPLVGQRLVPWYQYVDGEVRYACRFEYAQTAVDIIARRTRLAHLSCQAAKDALPRIVELMGSELGWTSSERTRQIALAEEYLKTCGLDELHPVRAEFQRAQLERYRAAYLKLVPDGGRLLPRIPLETALRGWKQLLTLDELTGPVDWMEVVRHADPGRLGTIGFGEFLDGLSFVHTRWGRTPGDFSGSMGNNINDNVKCPPTERSSWSM